MHLKSHTNEKDMKDAATPHNSNLQFLNSNSCTETAKTETATLPNQNY